MPRSMKPTRFLTSHFATPRVSDVSGLIISITIASHSTTDFGLCFAPMLALVSPLRFALRLALVSLRSLQAIDGELVRNHNAVRKILDVSWTIVGHYVAYESPSQRVEEKAGVAPPRRHAHGIRLAMCRRARDRCGIESPHMLARRSRPAVHTVASFVESNLRPYWPLVVAERQVAGSQAHLPYEG